MAAAELVDLDEDVLGRWLLARRWFGSKARDVAHARVLDVLELAAGPPALVVALVEARFPGGTHDLYQLPLSVGGGGEGGAELVELADGRAVHDALGDPAACATLGRLLRDGQTIAGEHARVAFHWIGDDGRALDGPARPIGAEQSNSSVVFDDAVVLKAYRRVEAGDNPELEMLRFLTQRGFPSIAALQGWYEYEGDLMAATLGVAQRYVPGGRDGWELVLDEMGSPALLEQLADLGRVIGAMHSVLASDPSDPAFAPEAPAEESLALLMATIDGEIERTFLDLPDDPVVAELTGRGDEVRERLRMLAQLGSRGRLIRHHGDLHLGQAMLGPDGTWVLLDFEGEPARSLLERRRKRSPLRDVAGMLRSFAYAASAGELLRGTPAPPEWEARARTAFLDAYFETVEPSLLPPSQDSTIALLSVFELEKAVYELRYELNNRPDWVPIPVAGIRRLLEEPVP